MDAMPTGRDGCGEGGLHGCPSCTARLHPKTTAGMLEQTRAAASSCTRRAQSDARGQGRVQGRALHGCPGPALRPAVQQGKGCAGTGRAAPGRELNE